MSVLMLLQGRGRMGAPALAEALQVSVRTIYRDVDQLSAAGVPVWAEPGRGGGICLREGWRTELTGLTPPEARAVVLAGLPGPAAALGLGAALPLARHKLLAALPADARGDAVRIAQRFHLDPTDWYRDATPPRWLTAVAEAVWSSRVLAMRYQSWERLSEQRVEPLGLVLKAGIWYVVARRARRGAEPRVYRIDAIESLETLPAGFTPPANFDLGAWWRERTDRFEAGLYTGTARLRVTEVGYRRLLNASPPVARAAAEHVRPCEHEGWVETQVPIEPLPHATGEMLRLGDQVEVLAPIELRRALHEVGVGMARLHAEHGGATGRPNR